MPGVPIPAAETPVVDATAGDADLPRLPVNGRFGRREIDRRAAGVAAAARDGMVSESHARRVIAAMLYGSSIPESVAVRWTGDRQHREDIADRLRLLVFTKAMQIAEGGLRLDPVADGASACGWATQLCRAALPSAARDVRLRQRELPHPAVGGGHGEATSMSFQTIAQVSDLLSPPAPDVIESVVAPIDRSGRVVYAAESGLLVMSGMRPGSRRHRGAAHLGRTLGAAGTCPPGGRLDAAAHRHGPGPRPGGGPRQCAGGDRPAAQAGSGCG